MAKKWSIKRAIFLWVGTSLCTSLLFSWGYFARKNVLKKRMIDPAYKLTRIKQTGPEPLALKTEYLEELLDLSLDQPISIYALSLKEAKKRLESSPLIAKASVKREPPDTLYIDYEVRKPVASLGDYQNIAFDKEGYLFPIVPFFSSKNFPSVYLGTGPLDLGAQWKIPEENRLFSIALEILEFFSLQKENIRVKKVDVSHALSPSLGTREIVILIEEDVLIEGENEKAVCTFPKILRLAPKEYQMQIKHFFSLRKKMLEDYKKQVVAIPKSHRFSERIVDLRIANLAFVENR